MRNFGDTQSVHELMERKDSSCSVMSDVGLLCISGRTSRLSSIGSAASGGSVASGKYAYFCNTTEYVSLLFRVIVLLL